VTLLSLCEHRCVSHLEAFSLTAVSAFSSALLRKKTEIFAEIWWKIMFRMCTNERLSLRGDLDNFVIKVEHSGTERVDKCDTDKLVRT